MKPPVIHPFAFVLLPVLSSPVAKASLPEAILIPLIALEVTMVLIFLLLKHALKDNLMAGISASMLVPYVFCFAAFRAGINCTIQSLFGQPTEDLIILATYTVCWGMTFFIIRRGSFQLGKSKLELDFARFTVALNVVSLFLLVTNGVQTVLYQANAMSQQSSMLAYFREGDAQFRIPQTAPQRPDIYYLILDCNAAPSTLNQVWDYDNSAFIQSLQSKGFHVVPEAFSNYDRTVLSIPSSLNMQYIDAIPERLGRDFNDETLNYRLIQDSRISRLLKSLGYKYINIFSGFPPTEYVPYADVNFVKSLGSAYLLEFMQLTILSGTEKYVPLTLDVFAETRLVPYKYASEIAALPGPKFVLVHSLISHPPNVFNEDGHKNPLSLAVLTENAPDRYLKQIKYTEKLVDQFVKTLLDRPGPEPIIIIQSDHGPKYRMLDDKAYYNQNMRILLAYHFPGQKNLHRRLTPVNVFRLMLNSQFGAKLPILPERAYCNINIESSENYKWKDVTDQLVFPTAQDQRADIK